MMRNRWLFVTVTCVLQIHVCYAAAIISRLLSSSYQPTPGVEERWVAEEEFYKAGDIANAESNVNNSDSWWDDEDEESNIDQLHDDYSTYPSTKDRSHEKQHRWRRRKRSENKDNLEESPPISKQSAEDTTTNDDLIQSSQYDDEHELRTDEWELDIRLSRLFAQEGEELFPESSRDDIRERDGKSSSTYPKLRSNDRYRKRQVMTFARNGYVKVSDSNNQDRIDNNTTPPRNNNRPRVGKWRIGHSGVAFDIPVLISANRKCSGTSNSDKVMSPKKMTVLHYHADIHLNKFGERPRMFRGVITRDRYDVYSLFQTLFPLTNLWY